MSSIFQWVADCPARQGLSASTVEWLRANLAGKGTKGFLLVRNDRIVCEWYSPDHGADAKHWNASLDKAIVAGLSLILAMGDGLISPDEPAGAYIPQWRVDPLKSQITIRHLATHCSGLENPALKRPDAESRKIWAKASNRGRLLKELPGWKGAFWRRDRNPFLIARDEAPVLFRPGSAYDYSNTGIAMLGYVLAACLKRAGQPDVLTLLRDRIMRPIGVTDDQWTIGHGVEYEADGLKLHVNWGGGEYTARAIARIGRLMLRKGEWDGRQVLDPAVVSAAVSCASTAIPDRADDCQPASGLCWWTNSDGCLSSLPRDAFAGMGASNQILLVIPCLNMIVVRHGENLDDRLWAGAEEHLFQPLMEAVLPPYPASPVIRRMTIEPERVSIGNGDNWPLAWADDGHLYTVYCDGTGWGDRRYSMGVARILGDPPGIAGENIPSPTGQQGPDDTGYDRRGRKASGLIMADGVLYMWVRNLRTDGTGSSLAWSSDHGRTWTWAGWSFPQIGYPVWLDFGQDSQLAADQHLYLYSTDSPSAYEPAAWLILGRVHRQALTNQNAYEWFSGLSADGKPVWDKNFDARQPVFVWPDGCHRPSVAFAAGLGRYLLCSTNKVGWFGVFDAPEPWGPWTTVLRTFNFGGGEDRFAPAIPSKWIGPNGAGLHLVYSCYPRGPYQFNVQRCCLEVR